MTPLKSHILGLPDSLNWKYVTIESHFSDKYKKISYEFNSTTEYVSESEIDMDNEYNEYSVYYFYTDTFFTLKDGTNTLTITVESPSGKTKKDYIIQINKIE